MPLTYIALYGEHKIPVGSCTLELDGGIRSDLGPWIGDLVVDQQYQRQGIGKMLLDVAIEKARALGFKKVYLFTFDPAITGYYQQFGWEKNWHRKFQISSCNSYGVGHFRVIGFCFFMSDQKRL